MDRKPRALAARRSITRRFEIDQAKHPIIGRLEAVERWARNAEHDAPAGAMMEALVAVEALAERAALALTHLGVSDDGRHEDSDLLLEFRRISRTHDADRRSEEAREPVDAASRCPGRWDGEHEWVPSIHATRQVCLGCFHPRAL